MSALEKCSRCGATSPVVQGGACGGCGGQSAINEAGSRVIQQMQDADRVNRGEEFDR